MLSSCLQASYPLQCFDAACRNCNGCDLPCQKFSRHFCCKVWCLHYAVFWHCEICTELKMKLHAHFYSSSWSWQLFAWKSSSSWRQALEFCCHQCFCHLQWLNDLFMDRELVMYRIITNTSLIRDPVVTKTTQLSKCNLPRRSCEHLVHFHCPWNGWLVYMQFINFRNVFTTHKEDLCSRIYWQCIEQSFCIGYITTVLENVICCSFQSATYTVWCSFTMPTIKHVPGGTPHAIRINECRQQIEISFITVLCRWSIWEEMQHIHWRVLFFQEQ